MSEAATKAVPHINDMYETTTPAEFVTWFDAVHMDLLIGSPVAWHSALKVAVELLRNGSRERDSDSD